MKQSFFLSSTFCAFLCFLWLFLCCSCLAEVGEAHLPGRVGGEVTYQLAGHREELPELVEQARSRGGVEACSASDVRAEAVRLQFLILRIALLQKNAHQSAHRSAQEAERIQPAD